MNSSSAPPPRPPVLLLGMHRSGTSIATRLVALLGLEVPQGLLIPPDEYNPGGYFESRALTDVGDLVLERLGSPWFAPPDVTEVLSRQAELDDLVPTALAEARRAFPHQHRPGVWKDPRTCVLLPFWDRVLGSSAPVVIVHRHPLEVADSLRRRQGFAVPYAVALWERHVRGALIGSGRRLVHVESYAALVGEPASWLDRVSGFLRHMGVHVDPPAQDVAGEISPPRAPSAWSDDELSMLTVEQATLLDLLRSLDGSSHDMAARQLPRESPTTAALLDHGRVGWVVRREVDAVREALMQQGSVSDELRTALRERDEQLRSRYAQLAQAEATVSSLEATVSSLEATVSSLEADAVAAAARLQAAEERLRHLEETLDAVYASHSWRAAAPLRGAVTVGRASARRLRGR